MAISDSTYLGFEARGTTGSTIMKSAALTLAIVLAQYPISRLDSGESSIRLAGTEETLARPLMLQTTEMDLLLEMNRVYNDLLGNQVDLDIDSKRVLYSNLWDLYT
jgi:hypothetical protein